MYKVFTIAKKELSDHISDRNFLLIYLIMVSITAIVFLSNAEFYNYMQLINLADTAERGGTWVVLGSYAETIWFIYDDIVNVISPIYALMAFIISSHGINGELNSGTLKVTLSYPVYRDHVFIGKMLGGILIISLVSLSAFVIGFALFILKTGMMLSLDLLIRILLIVFSTVSYSMVFFGIGLLFSITFNNTLKSFLASLTVWIVLTEIYWMIRNSLAYLLGYYGFSGRNFSGDYIAWAYFNERTNLLNVHSQLADALSKILDAVRIGGVEDSQGVMHTTVTTIPIEKTLPSLVTPFSIITVNILFIFILSYILFRRKEIF